VERSVFILIRAALWILGLTGMAMVLVMVWHYMAPEALTWLSAERIRRVEDLVTGGVAAWGLRCTVLARKEDPQTDAKPTDKDDPAKALDE